MDSIDQGAEWWRQQVLELDLDTRIASLLGECLSDEIFGLGLWPYLRVAYGLGYLDALTEPVRGQLCRDHRFAVPPRRSQKVRPARRKPR